MSRDDYISVAKAIRQFRNNYKNVLTQNMISDLNTLLETAKRGEQSYGEVVDKLLEYEALYGEKISNEYDVIKRARNAR